MNASVNVEKKGDKRIVNGNVMTLNVEAVTSNLIAVWKTKEALFDHSRETENLRMKNWMSERQQQVQNPPVWFMHQTSASDILR